uniref:H15 domain-containing protein n=1 Tax=Terrapene triunguis TaxID=2587831 RepID=A0A674IX17_9SAUR
MQTSQGAPDVTIYQAPFSWQPLCSSSPRGVAKWAGSYSSSLTKPSGSRISKPSTSPGASLAKLSKPLSQGLSKLILEAVATSKKRTGLSLQALKKIIAATGYNMAKKKTHFKRVLLSLVTKGLLQKLKGTGASGSFGIGKEMAKKMGPGHKKKKASKKRGRPLKTGSRSRNPGRKRKAGMTQVPAQGEVL